MMSRDGGKGFARMAGMMGGGGGMDRLKALGGGKPALPQGGPSEADLAKLQEMMGGQAGAPKLPEGMKLPGLGGGGSLPPGFNPFKKS
jgi:signal recognition particle subunit SRP54